MSGIYSKLLFPHALKASHPLWWPDLACFLTEGVLSVSVVGYVEAATGALGSARPVFRVQLYYYCCMKLGCSKGLRNLTPKDIMCLWWDNKWWKPSTETYSKCAYPSMSTTSWIYFWALSKPSLSTCSSIYLSIHLATQPHSGLSLNAISQLRIDTRGKRAERGNTSSHTTSGISFRTQGALSHLLISLYKDI